jgi:hypothetical protein
LDLAHDIPCQAQFPHVCNGPSIPAHSNQQIHGRGFAHKTHDCFIAAVCPAAHDAIDGRSRGMDKETKQAEWNRAYIATQIYLWNNGKVKVA